MDRRLVLWLVPIFTTIHNVEEALLMPAIVAGDGGVVPELIVVQANTREIMKVFPSGKLPANPLQSNTIYETEPGGKRKVRYLTLYQWSEGGPKFAVFAREAEPSH